MKPSLPPNKLKGYLVPQVLGLWLEGIRLSLRV